MMQKYLALILLTPFLTACPKPIEVGRPAPPRDRLVCKEAPDKPILSPLQPIVASNGATVYPKADVDARDAQIAEYIVNYRGAWFDCKSQLAWVNDYFDGQ